MIKSILVRPQPSPTSVLTGPASDSAPCSDLPSQQRVITTLDELDEALTMLDAAAAKSDDALRHGFSTFKMALKLDLPADPDSQAYRDQQMELYQWLHGKPYSTANEVTAFEVDRIADRPFPYSTESAQTVGNQLMAIGHIIKTMNLQPGSRVLEFGPGWGNTTINLARMGYAVTAVDIEPNFIELLQRRAQRKNLNLTTIRGDFSTINTLEEQFDAVLFFECFHHCADHQALIASLDRVIAPGGKVIFAGEPITDLLPLPWGLRMDGESLWAIRKHGWLELGFQESYFRKLLARHGWRLEKSVCSDTPWGVIFVATRASSIAAR